MTGRERTTTKMPRLLRVTQVAAMLVTGFLLGAHASKWDSIRVDAITLGLLGLLIAIPLVELIKKIKVGEFEAEIGKEEVANAQAKAAVELPAAAEARDEASRFRDLLAEDPPLALAKVRIELEEALKRLHSTVKAPSSDLRRLSLGRIVDDLVRFDVMSPPLSAALRDVISLANRAIHGETVDADAAEQLAILGIRMVSELKQLYMDRAMRPVQSVVLKKEELDDYDRAQYRVTTVIPLIENPTKNTYVFDQNALNNFLDGYNEYAEFIVQVEKV